MICIGQILIYATIQDTINLKILIEPLYECINSVKDIISIILFKKMEHGHECPGCRTSVDESAISQHIRQCEAYNPHFLKQAMKIVDQNPAQNELMFIQAELSLAI